MIKRRKKTETNDKDRIGKLKEEGAKMAESLKSKANSEILCNDDLLRSLGITGPLIGVFSTKIKEQRYCSKNEITCCTAENIQSIAAKFQDGVHIINRRISMLEELLAVFHGQAYFTIIQKIKKEEQTQCDYVFGSAAARLNFVNDEYLYEQADRVNNLLEGLSNYLKTQLWLRADFICAACSPTNYQFISLSAADKKEIALDEHTYKEILHIKEFEANVAELFYNFIVPYANAVACIEATQKDVNWFVNKYEEVNNTVVKFKANVSFDSQKPVTPQDAADASVAAKLAELQNSTLLKIKLSDDAKNFIANVKNCNNPLMSVHIEACKSLCTQKIDTFSFPFPFFNDVALTLKTVFNALSEKFDIQKYYRTVREFEFTVTGNDEPVPLIVAPKNNAGIEAYKFNFVSGNAMQLFKFHMTKRFTMEPQVPTSILKWITKLFTSIF